MKTSRNLKVCLLTILLSGSMTSACSTYIVHNDSSIIPAPYLGTKRAIRETGRHMEHYDYYGQVLLYLMDVPLCLIADTVVLPYDLYRAKRDKKPL
jgi:uncharacterized protein YceK